MGNGTNKLNYRWAVIVAAAAMMLILGFLSRAAWPYIADRNLIAERSAAVEANVENIKDTLDRMSTDVAKIRDNAVTRQEFQRLQNQVQEMNTRIGRIEGKLERFHSE